MRLTWDKQKEMQIYLQFRSFSIKVQKYKRTTRKLQVKFEILSQDKYKNNPTTENTAAIYTKGNVWETPGGTN